MLCYLEAHLALAVLAVTPVHAHLGALVALGPERVHGLREVTAQRRLVPLVQRLHLSPSLQLAFHFTRRKQLAMHGAEC